MDRDGRAGSREGKSVMTAVDGEAARKHWAFQPLKSFSAPAVEGQGGDQRGLGPTGLDRFIRTKLAEESLSPNPPADRPTLIRRVSFDLTGLPPTPEEIAAFLKDPASDAESFSKVVNRLLDSPTENAGGGTGSMSRVTPTLLATERITRSGKRSNIATGW